MVGVSTTATAVATAATTTTTAATTSASAAGLEEGGHNRGMALGGEEVADSINRTRSKQKIGFRRKRFFRTKKKNCGYR